MTSPEEILDRYKKVHDALKNKLGYGNIYHYTDKDGLEGILKEKRLRFTSYAYLNDPGEIKYGKDLMLRALQLHCQNQDFIKLLYGKTADLFYNLDTQLQSYVCSFSTETEKLSLWRYYGKNGTGFSLGFNEGFYKTTSIEKYRGQPEPVLGRVIYGLDECGRLVNQAIKIFYAAVKDNQNIFLEEYKGLICTLLSIMPFFKDISFQDEHEVRFIVSEGELFKWKFEEKDREFVPIEVSNIPFVNGLSGTKSCVKPREFCKHDISEIWIGPSCNLLEAEKFINELLEKYNYDLSDIEIRQCPLPFRHV